MSMSMSTTNDALSLRSMTRASTHSAQGSDMLPTPQDDLATFNLPHGKHRIESSAYSEPPHIEDIFVNHPPYGTPPRQGLVPPHFGSGRHEWRSYSSDDVGAFQPRTTRDLIGMYENNRSSGDVPTERTNPYALTGPRRENPLPPSPANTFPKNKLPLRDSFRNLLSAFGRKKDRKDDIGAGPYIPAPTSRQEAQHLQVIEAEMKARMRSSDTVETFSIAREGPLLHLDTRVIPPRWHACDATLHASHMNLRWCEANGHANVHDMVLALCTNVKSVAANAIDPAMSPVFGNNEHAHVFVMEFENGEERFATSTVTERVAWVNALWDGILRCRDVSSSHSAEHIEQQDTGSSVAPAEPPMILRVVNSPSPDSSMSEDPPRNSRFRSHTPNSPSLGRLDSENLVKQRLAQYEQKFGSSTSSWKSSGPSVYSQRPARPSAKDKHNEMVSSTDEPFNAMHSALDAAFWGGSRHRKAASEQPVAFSTMRRADSARSKSSLQRHATTASVPPPPIEKDDPFSSEVTVTLKNIGRDRLAANAVGNPLPSRPDLKRADSDDSSVVGLQPLYSLLRQQSTTQLSSTELVTSQIGGMREDLTTLMRDVQTALMSAPSSSPQLERLEGQLNALLNRLSALDLQPLHEKLDRLVDPSIQSMSNVARRDRPLPPVLDFGPILASLDDLKRKSRPQPPVDYQPVLDKIAISEGLQHADHNAVMQKLDELRAAMVAREDLGLVISMLNEVSLRGTSSGQPDGAEQAGVTAMLAEILDRLGALGLGSTTARAASPVPSTSQSIPSEGGLTTVFASPSIPAPDQGPDMVSNVATKANSTMAQEALDVPKDDAEDSRHANVMTELQQIGAVIKDLSTSSALLGSQHTDSIRYLGELNKWLEAFVKNTTMQVDGIHAGIGRLSQELGIPPLVPMQPLPPHPPQDGEPPVQTLGNVGTGPSPDAPTADASPPPGGILQEMRQYLAENKGKQQQTQLELQTAMQASVSGAAQDIDARAHERQKAATEALFAFMEQQRQTNEALLRGIAAELSNDIRGERLRFVDAMKEATTVNIQFHVEEFKKQLTKEVLTMTIEVERLQRERQVLQLQISELFAFFSKQKQAVGMPQGQAAPDARPLPQEPPAVQTMANLPPRRRRA